MECSDENESESQVRENCNEEKPDLKGDYMNLVILFFLYVLQGDEKVGESERLESDLLNL